jgi:hypothetical protein
MKKHMTKAKKINAFSLVIKINNKLLINVMDKMNLTQLKLKSKVVITIEKSTKILQAMKQRISQDQ